MGTLSIFELGAVTVNEMSGVVIRGEGFCHSLSFPRCFLLGGRNLLCAVHESAYDRAFMLGMQV